MNALDVRRSARHGERPQSRFRDEAGQAVVEFALVMPILLLIVIGIVEFGRAWNVQQTLTDAAREGARAAAIFKQPTVQEDSVVRVVQNALRARRVDPAYATVTSTNVTGATGEPLTVRVQYPYTFRFLARLMSIAGGSGTITLRTEFTMRNE